MNDVGTWNSLQVDSLKSGLEPLDGVVPSLASHAAVGEHVPLYLLPWIKHDRFVATIRMNGAEKQQPNYQQPLSMDKQIRWIIIYFAHCILVIF